MKFLNPYVDPKPLDILRICVDVSRSDVARIRAVTGDWHMMQVAVSMFIKHLYEYSVKHDLTINQCELLKSYISTICTVPTDPCESLDFAGLSTNTISSPILGDPAHITPTGANRNDGRRADEVRSGGPSTPDKPATMQRKSSRKKGQQESGNGISAK